MAGAELHQRRLERLRYWGTAFSATSTTNKQKPMRVDADPRPSDRRQRVRAQPPLPGFRAGQLPVQQHHRVSGHQAVRTVEDGSGFVGVEVEPLLQSTDANFRPVAMQFGPDSALYVVDWFNPLVGHMQYSLRDRGATRRTGGCGASPPRAGRCSRPRNPRRDDRAADRSAEGLRGSDPLPGAARAGDQPTAEVLPAVQRWIDGLDPADPKSSTTCSRRCGSTSTDTVNLPLLKRLLEGRRSSAPVRRRCVCCNWFDRVDGAMALLAPMVRDEAPRPAGSGARRQLLPTPAAAEAALGILAKPMDYYLQCVLDSTMTTLEPVWKPRLTSGASFAVRPAWPSCSSASRARRAGVGEAQRPVYEALLTRSGIEPALRRDALNVLATRAGVSVGTALLAAVSRVAATPGAGAATADLMRLLADLPCGGSGRAASALENLAPGALDTVRQGALSPLRLDGSADAVGVTGASARLRTDLLRAAAAAPEGPAVDSLRAAVLPWLRDAVATGAAPGPAAAADDRPLRPARAPGPGNRVERHRSAGLQRRRERRDEGHRDAVEHCSAAPPAARGARSTAASSRTCRPAPIRSRARSSSRAPNRIPGGARSRRRAANRHHRAVGRIRRHADRASSSILDASRKPVSSRTACGSRRPCTPSTWAAT